MLIDILVKERDFVTTKYLAKQLDVSERTIRSDLDKVADYIEPYNAELIRKPGSGTKLAGSHYEILRVRNSLSYMVDEPPNFTSQERVTIITILLLMNSGRYYTSDIAEGLFYSRSTIHTDLNRVEKILNSYKLQLIRGKNNRLAIVGRERRIRSCLVDILIEHPDIQKLVELIISDQAFNEEEQVLRPLNIQGKDLNYFVTLMRDTNHVFISQLTLQSFIILLLYILVSYIRYREGFVVSLSEEFLENIQEENLYEDVNTIAENIYETYQVELPEIEKRYIQIYFLSQNRKEDDRALSKRAASMAKALIQSWSEQLEQPLSKQEELLDNLIRHIKPALVRFEYGIYFENTMLNDIRRTYPEEFLIVQKSLEQFSQQFDEPIADEEAGYLTLHLLTSVERDKQPLQAILVTHIGSGGQRYIKEKIEKNIARIKIIETINYFSFYEHSLADIDLVITTIDLNLHQGLPVIQINPLITSADLQAIRDSALI